MNDWGRSLLPRYALALLCTLLAVWGRQLIDPALGSRAPFVTFFPNVVLVAYYAGLGPSLVTIGISGLAASHLFIPPSNSLLPDAAGWATLLLFTGLGGGIAFGMEWAKHKAASTQEEIHRQLQISEKQLTDFFEHAPVAIRWLSPDGIVLRANQAELDLLGYAKEEYIGRPMRDFHADPDTYQEILERIQSGETVIKLPARLRGKDNSFRDVLVSCDGVFEKDKLIQIRCITVDITKHKQRMQALEESEERFRLLADTAPVLIWMSGPDKEGVYFNKSWLEFTGMPAEEQKGEGWLELVHPEDRDPLTKICQEGFGNQTGFTTEFRLRRADGEYRWLLDTGSPRFDSEGAFLGFIGSCVDITDRKRAEEFQTQLAAIVESSEDAMISMSPDGGILSWNTGAQELFGYNAEEAIAQHITLIIPPELHDEEEGILAKLRNGERIAHYETVRVAKDGRRLDISLTISPIRDAQGKIVAVSKVGRDITAHKRAVEDLRENEERFRELANNIDQFAWTTDETGAITWYNQRWYDYTGTTLEEMQGWGWQTVHHPDHLDRVVERIKQAFKTGERWEDTFPLRGKDGQYRWFLSRAVPIHDAEGNVIRWFGTNTDVTKELEVEEALRESEERFRTMANITPAILWTADADGAITWSSDRWFEYTGISREENPQHWDQVLHPDDREHCLAAWQKALKEGSPYEIESRYRHRNGEYRWFLARATAVRDARERITGWCGSSTDIHSQKQMEQSQRFLAEASKSLSSLVDYKSTLQMVAQLSVPSFADWCAVDMRGQADKALQRVAVAHRDSSRLSLVEDLANFDSDESGAPFCPRHVFEEGRSVLIEEFALDDLRQAVKNPDQLHILEELQPVSSICVPLRAKKRCLGVITFVSAESGRRYAANDLALAEDLARRASVAIENARLYQEVQEAHRRKDEFLAMLAHELRNPLAPIRSGLDILAMEETSDRETIRVMQDQVEHVVRLVDDLLDVSRIMRNKIELRKELAVLSVLVHRSVEAVRPLVDNQRQDLRITLPDQPVWMNVDPVRLIQVMENLLNNASKYTEEGGRIELRAEVEGQHVVIRVIDTGVGIEPDLLPSVFELFTQSRRSLDRSQGGLGIGLTLVHRLVEMHEGTIHAFSEGPGRGSTFVVRLPLAEAPPEDEVVKMQTKAAQSRRIVVVDDNIGAAMLLSKLLGMLGEHQVYTAHDGLTALDLISKTHPEIVLLDIGLPGMNGYQVAQAVREKPELDEVLLVALTGYGQKEDRLKSRKAGFDEHRVKPPSIDQMRELLQHPKLDAIKQRMPIAPQPTPTPAVRPPQSPLQSPLDSKDNGEAPPKPDQRVLPQFKHDLTNVAHVLTLISELFLTGQASPAQIQEAKQAVADEIATIKRLVGTLQDVIDNRKS